MDGSISLALSSEINLFKSDILHRENSVFRRTVFPVLHFELTLAVFDFQVARRGYLAQFALHAKRKMRSQLFHIVHQMRR